MKQLTIHEHVAQNLAHQGDTFLTFLLLALAGLLIFIALQPDHVIWKAIVAAWVVLP